MRFRSTKTFIVLSIAVSLLLSTGFSFASLRSGLPQILPPAGAAFPFIDAKGHPAEAAIAEMYAKGVMRGYDDGTFKPKRPVTFLEAEVMLDKLIWGNPIKSDFTSNDYLHTQFGIPNWAVGLIASALRNNILMYNELQQLSRQQPLTREEAAILAVRALELTNQVSRKQNSPLPFQDAAQISEKARGYVAIAWEQKIFMGSEGKFHPADPISRAEMAIVLSRIVLQNPALQSDEITGFVKAVTPLTTTVSLVDSNDQEIIVKLPKQSLYYLNDKPASFAELTAGNNIRIINTDNSATTVVISHFVAPDTGTALIVNPVKPSAALPKVQQWTEENKVSEGYHFKAFEDGLYFLAARGEKMHSGFAIEITRISSSEDDKGIHYRVWIDKSDPPRDTLVLPLISYPMAIGKINLPPKPIVDVTFVNKLNQEITVVTPSPSKAK